MLISPLLHSKFINFKSSLRRRRSNCCRISPTPVVPNDRTDQHCGQRNPWAPERTSFKDCSTSVESLHSARTQQIKNRGARLDSGLHWPPALALAVHYHLEHSRFSREREPSLADDQQRDQPLLVYTVKPVLCKFGKLYSSSGSMDSVHRAHI